MQWGPNSWTPGYMSEPPGEVLKKTEEPVSWTLVQWFQRWLGDLNLFLKNTLCR